MENKDLIAIFEQLLPNDLRLSDSSVTSSADNEYNEQIRSYLFGAAARDYFNRIIRPVLAQQIAMRTGEDGAPFSTDAIYGKSTMDKYLAMLEENDELRTIFYQKEPRGYLGACKDLGLF
jgi:hypothetical protein